VEDNILFDLRENLFNHLQEYTLLKMYVYC